MTNHAEHNQRKNTAIIFTFAIGVIAGLLTTLCLAGSTLFTFNNFGLDWGATVLIACVPLLGIFIGGSALLSTGIHAWRFQRRHGWVPSLKYFGVWGVTWTLAILILTLVFLNTAAEDETTPFLGALILIILANVCGSLLASWSERQ